VNKERVDMVVPRRRLNPYDRGTCARIALVATVAAALAPVRADAQRATMGEGALDLLLPTGARAVALGQATMGMDGTTESVWWNPSGLARMHGTSAAIHHSQSIGGKADAVSVVAHSRLLGSFGVSASLRDFGASGNSDDSGTEGGTILPRSLIYAATYAASLERLNVGLSYKLVQWRIDCTGPCTGETGILASTSAVDAGAQYSFDPSIPIRFGASVRNVGLRMQVNDEPQSDDLPSRLQAGMEWRVSALESLIGGAQLRLSADMVSALSRMDPSPRIGAEIGWQRRLLFRGGYASRSGGYGGPSLGVGYDSGTLAIDFARLFDEVSSATGMEPTYLSVRYRF
jgi:hypothetical protein